MSLDEKLKILDKTKIELEMAAGNLFDAGTSYDLVFPSEKENHFYRLRWEVHQKIEQVKQAAAQLRLDAEKSQSES